MHPWALCGAVSFCLTKGFKVFVLLFHSFQRRSSFIVYVCVCVGFCVYGCVCVRAAILKSMLEAVSVPFSSRPRYTPLSSTLQHCSHIFINSRALSAIFPWPPNLRFPIPPSIHCSPGKTSSWIGNLSFSPLALGL